MKPLSDTPETDALINSEGEVFGPAYFQKFAKHARQLERELIAACEERDGYKKALNNEVGCWDGTAKHACEIVINLHKAAI